jgi:hypothetical protein
MFTGITRHNLDPDLALENTKGKLSGFVIAGYDLEGEAFFSSTYADGGDALWLIEKFKQALLNVEVQDD